MKKRGSRGVEEDVARGNIAWRGKNTQETTPGEEIILKKLIKVQLINYLNPVMGMQISFPREEINEKIISGEGNYTALSARGN